MDNWFRYYRQPKKLKFEFKDPSGNVQTGWISYEDWKFMRDFRNGVRGQEFPLTSNECFYMKPDIPDGDYGNVRIETIDIKEVMDRYHKYLEENE